MDERLKIPEGYSAAILHTHTSHTDGIVTPAKLVESAAIVGVKVLALTDHDTMSSVNEARRAGNELGVDVIAGEEIQTSLPRGLHIVGLFLKEPVAHSKPVEWTIGKIREQGGLAIAAHPMVALFGEISAPTGALQMKDLVRISQSIGFDGVEVRHGYLSRKNRIKLEEFCAEREKTMGAEIGSADSHFGEDDMFSYITLFPGETAKDLYFAIKDRTTKAMAGFSSEVSTKARLLQMKRALFDLGLKRYRRMVGRWLSFNLNNVHEVID